MKYLLDRLDIVQLLYLESKIDPEEDAEIDELKGFKSHIEYLIHLPIDVDKHNILKLDHFIPLLKRFSELSQLGNIIHPIDDEYFFSFLEKYWRDFNLIVENIDDIDLFEDIMEIGCEICVDVGHLIINGQSVKEFVNKYQERIRPTIFMV